MIPIFILTFLLGVVHSVPELLISQCSYKDSLCMSEAQNRHYRKFSHDYHLDPLDVSTFDLTSPALFVTFFNPTLKGLKGCSIVDVKLDVKNRKLSHTLACPWVIVTGHYRAKGLVLGVRPVDGHGPFYIILYDYAVEYESDITIYEGADGKDHMRIENVTRRELTLRGDVVLEFKNLVDGDKHESEEAQRFLDENSRPVFLAYQYPFFNNFFTEIIRRLNNYFSVVPMIDIFSGPQHKWMDKWIK